MQLMLDHWRPIALTATMSPLIHRTVSMQRARR